MKCDMRMHMGVFSILPNYNIPGTKSPIIGGVNIDITYENKAQNTLTMMKHRLEQKTPIELHSFRLQLQIEIFITSHR